MSVADPEISKEGFTVKNGSRTSPNLGRVTLEGNFLSLNGGFLV